MPREPEYVFVGRADPDVAAALDAAKNLSSPCWCGLRRKAWMSMCHSCWYQLPAVLQLAIDADVNEAISTAIDWLKSPPADHQETDKQKYYRLSGLVCRRVKIALADFRWMKQRETAFKRADRDRDVRCVRGILSSGGPRVVRG